MKFLISSLLLSLVLLELSQAQDQNCQGASCNHARRKRQVIEEILNEVEEVDRERREAFFGKKHGLRLSQFSRASKHSSKHKFHHASKQHGHHHKRDADAQSQNCFESACNQNNFGKKKREIFEAINSLTAEVLENEVVAAQEKERRNADPQSQNCFGSSCNQNNFGKKKREAVEDDVDEVVVDQEKERRDADPDPQSQNCFGSACNQNNFGKKKRDAVEDDVDEVVEVQDKERRDADADPQSQNCFGSACNQNNFGKKKRDAVENDVDEVVEAQKERREADADAQSQNCFGSACNQNNFGKKKRDAVEDDVEEDVEAQEKVKRDADPQSQNCFGSACNQNNFGKKKREILEAINSLTKDMLEGEEAAAVGAAEDEERERRNADPQSQNCFGSFCNQNNGRKKRDIIAALIAELL